MQDSRHDDAAKAAPSLRGALLQPLLIIAAGLVAVIYGTLFNTKPVLVEQALAQPPGTTTVEPGAPPAPAAVSSTESNLVITAVAEPDILWDATRGAITRLPSGALKRGAPAPACPT